MELLLPAGGFQAGIQALDHGADAVYFGFGRFSARGRAENFTFDEVRRLKTRAVEREARIYAAFNTIVTDAEFPAFRAVCDQAVTAGIDAAIVQDLGVLHYIRSAYPGLPVHASTQMAVHTVSGLRQLHRLGAARAVLSRELTIPEIAALHREVPQIELEVFVHGALCYSVSGLCLASGMLLGRSANRGECGQVCRTWFSSTEASPSAGYFFSMKDLERPHAVQELTAAGVCALKIEGRMKSPEYCAAAADYYRSVLDTGGGETPERLRTIFSRAVTEGWSESRASGERLTVPDYPGHRGIPAAVVTAADPKRNTVELRVLTRLSLRDGLLYLTAGRKSGLLEPVRFSLSRMQSPEGDSLTQAEAGSRVLICVPTAMNAGDTLSRISASDQTLPLTNPDSIHPWKYPVDLSLRADHASAAVSGSVPGCSTPVEVSLDVPVERARSAKAVGAFAAAVERAFRSSADSLFTAGDISLSSGSPIPEQELFIPPSGLKELRRRWFKEADERFYAAVKAKRSYADPADAPPLKETSLSLPPRAALVPQSAYPVPFLLSPEVCSPEDLPRREETWFLPLNPVLFDEEQYFTAVRALIGRFATGEPGGNRSLLIGLNNLGHILRIPQLREAAPAGFEIGFFADIYLYCANSQALLLLDALTGENMPGYWWLEGEQLPPVLSGRLRETSGLEDPPFSPPLFISRTCFRRESLGKSCSGCPGNAGPYRLRQNRREFTAVVRKCITYLFALPEDQLRENLP
jgi:U32 family peptidase